MEKRGYMLQEFVAHASDVNCLSTGKKSNRVFITGGEDRKVNLWSIGKPSPLLSLNGHTTGVDSVAFDSGEVLVLAGASNGSIKLWDLEEAKIVRTLTGHRSSCKSVEFHPFGEFFASGSLDSDLKIWDIRKKGCIHTYKGHTRGIRTIRFTPDGRWVVTGGDDNIVKVWDLTAGKLLHDFKFHTGHIQCINFHPQEFLLATGSADRTVKFWDLETFELIGSTGSEASGVRSMTFHPDGRTLFSGLDSTLKVYSWEPVRCHDVVEIGWAHLADLSIYEGKLLGFSFYQSRVSLWLADISLIGPYALGVHPKAAEFTEPLPLYTQNKNQDFPSKSSEKTIDASSYISNLKPMSPDRVKRENNNKRYDSKLSASSSLRRNSSSLSSTSSRTIQSNLGSRGANSSSKFSTSSSPAPKRVGPAMSESVIPFKDIHPISAAPVLVPRERISDHKIRKGVAVTKDSTVEVGVEDSSISSSRTVLLFDSVKKDSDSLFSGKESGVTASRPTVTSTGCSIETIAEKVDKSLALDKGYEAPCSTYDTGKVRYVRGVAVQLGRTRSLVETWERREKSTTSSNFASRPETPISFSPSKGPGNTYENEQIQVDEGIIIPDKLMQNHDVFINSIKSRLTKLQVVHHFFVQNGIKGAIDAVAKLPDHSVQVDLISLLKEKTNIFNLETFSYLLPVLTSLLDSKTDRHVTVSIEMIMELIKIFGAVIHSTLSANSPVGVDIQAEQRLERCTRCFNYLRKIQSLLHPLTWRGGQVAKLAQELDLSLNELLQL